MGLGGQRHAPAALPPGKTRYPLYRRLGGPQGWSGQVRKISPPPGFDPHNRPARSESLYRLRYPGPIWYYYYYYYYYYKWVLGFLCDVLTSTYFIMLIG